MERWISRLACVVVLAAVVWLQDASYLAIDEVDDESPVLPAVTALLAVLAALAVAVSWRLAERWVLAALLVLEIPVTVIALGWAGEGATLTDSALLVALLWLSPLPIPVSLANERTPLLGAVPARVIAVLVAAISWGRAVLVWFGAPLIVLAAVGAVAFLGPPGEGIVLPFLVTTPTACGWAIFAFAAWNRIDRTPMAVRSGEPSTE